MGGMDVVALRSTNTNTATRQDTDMYAPVIIQKKMELIESNNVSVSYWCQPHIQFEGSVLHKS